MRELVDAERWIKGEIGAAQTALSSLEDRLVAVVNGKPPSRPEPKAAPARTLIDELADLDAVSVLVFLTLSTAQRAIGGPVRATRAELAAKVKRSERSVTRALTQLRDRELVHRLSRWTYGVRTASK